MIRWQLIACSFFVTALATCAGCGRPEVASYVTSPEEVEKIRATLASKSTASGTGAQAEAAAKATGWATLKGRFAYDGAPPSPKALNVNKDQEVCSKHPLVNESLVVGSDKGLANVVLFVRNRKVEVHPDYEATATKPVLLDNQGCRFEPHIATVRTSQPLVVKNSDPVPHNTNAALAVNEAFNESIPPGKELQRKLTSAELGPASVSCTIHPWMKGYVLVQPHPYMAVSAKDGTFEIKNLPAGVPLEFQLWHEASTGNNGALALDGGDVKSQANGRFTLTLQPDEVKDLKEIKVPAAKLSAG
jgi:plastocyanin